MWRSFFLATGIFSIVLGFQTLAVDQFNVVNFRRIPKMVASKALGYMGQNGGPQVVTNSGFRPPGQFNGSSNGFVQRPTGNSRQSPASAYGPSAYGPSRYQGTQSGSFNRITDNRSQYVQPRQPMPQQRSPFQQQPSSTGQFGLAGYENRVLPQGQNGYAPVQAKTPRMIRGRQPRIVNTQDWMPWSLMAAGTIIVLYTSSKRRHEGE